ncbi:MAG: DUF2911 domain-containing protein [Candidatus Melainabacteria bacterium]|jgi:hypothetical protein|nr:DUF2911 domain-containing protein [Candidatus Melainabacteria bacterium]
MKLKQIPVVFAFIGALMTSSAALADTAKLEFPAPSPQCTLKQRVGLTDIEVTYSRPGLKGREVFGSMIPYGKVWRTGANAATKMVFSTDVKIDGHEIPAGTYALMTIPGKDEWTVIINKGSDQWGTYKYDEKNDLVRFTVKPVSTPSPVETMTIEFDNFKDESADMKLVWDKVKVPMKLEVSYIDKLTKQIETEMASDKKDKPYFQAANFWFNHEKDLQQAKKWVDAAVAERDAFYIVHLQAKILAKLGDKTAALAAAKHSLELANKANDLAYVKLNESLIKTLQ